MQFPIILAEGSYNQADLDLLIKNNEIVKTVDIYAQQMTEYFEISNPALKGSTDLPAAAKKYVDENMSKGKLFGSWIYYPWSRVLVHSVTQDKYFELRTNRNKNLIDAKEQEKLYNLNVGVLGLSIGSSMAIGLAYSAIAGQMKLADFDTLSTSNLNRLKAKMSDVGRKKIEIAAEQIFEINPYQNLELFENGVDKNSLDSFLAENPKPELIFEAIDDFEIKIRLRMAARNLGIPVIMLTNLGDSLLVDVERYDKDKTTPILNGMIEQSVVEEILSGRCSEADKNRFAVQVVGVENVPKRAMDSLKEIGLSLVGRPQLMSTVTIGGGLASFLARKIALGEDLPSGRKIIKWDELI
ncbi:MAG: ThiF family adenylyltransferase [Candidatus Magasanikbacteria bacterium]|nr:ThiF family adenylyltransferase [Candidatus Magasanikbacteria bacterium]